MEIRKYLRCTPRERQLIFSSYILVHSKRFLSFINCYKRNFIKRVKKACPYNYFFRGLLNSGCVGRNFRGKVNEQDFYRLKGQANEIFRLQFFSLNGLSWFQYTCLKAISNFVKFSWSYLYVKYQNIDSPLSLTTRSKKFSLRQPIFLTLLKCS